MGSYSSWLGWVIGWLGGWMDRTIGWRWTPVPAFRNQAYPPCTSLLCVISIQDLIKAMKQLQHDDTVPSQTRELINQVRGGFHSIDSWLLCVFYTRKPERLGEGVGRWVGA